MSRKFLATIVALVLALATLVPAFASPDNPDPGTAGRLTYLGSWGPFTITGTNTVVGSGPFSATDRYWSGNASTFASIVTNVGGSNKFVPPAGTRRVVFTFWGFSPLPQNVSYAVYADGASPYFAHATGTSAMSTSFGAWQYNFCLPIPGSTGNLGFVFTSPSSIPHTAQVDFYSNGC